LGGRRRGRFARLGIVIRIIVRVIRIIVRVIRVVVAVGRNLDFHRNAAVVVVGVAFVRLVLVRLVRILLVRFFALSFAAVLDGNLDVKPIYRDIQVLLVRIIVARVGVGVFRGRIVSRLRRAIARLRVGIRRAVARLRRVAAGVRGVTRSDGELHCLGRFC